MRQTTRADTHNSTGPLSGTGPYEYDLPVARDGAGQPAPVKRLGWKNSFSWRGVFIVIFGNMAARAFIGWSGLSPVYSFAILYCLVVISVYWDIPKPRPGFVRWTLKVVGIFLNLFIALVTVPRSLHGLLPESLAFALPAFVCMLIFYRVSPLMQTSRTTPLWQWLLWALAFAAVWAWVGPYAVR